jgi:hypothetical protein
VSQSKLRHNIILRPASRKSNKNDVAFVGTVGILPALKIN